MSCTGCAHEFKENEGRYNHSDGMLCQKCEKNIDNIEVTQNQTLFEKDFPRVFSEHQELGKYTVDGELLSKYVNATNHLKYFTTIAIGQPEMFLIDNIIKKKQLLLRELFANANLSCDSISVNEEATNFLELIDEWTNSTLKCTAK